MRVVICGGGVIGASLAYFLSLKHAEVVVVERSGVACAASGKSGGFLALDWCDGTPLAPLARRSFQLHAELAAKHEGKWGYRRLETLSVAASAKRRLGGPPGADRPGWLAPEARVHQRLGTPATTAQVSPAGFTQGMMDAAIARGAELRIGTVTGLARSADGRRATGVLIDRELLEGDAVVIAMGPWSVLAAEWLPLPMIYGLKGHSVVFRSSADITPHALFVECEAADGGVDTPEVFPRPDGTTYICGLSSEEPLPLDPDAIGPTRRHGAAQGDDPDLRPGAGRRRDPRHPGLLPAGRARRPAADRRGRRPRRRLRRDRPQRLGHAECAGDRRGAGRADPRGCLPDGRPRAVRPRPSGTLPPEAVALSAR